jgi:hypothetical protein
MNEVQHGRGMHFFLLGIAVLVALLLIVKFVAPLLRELDPYELAATLDRDGAHEMLERHLRYMALAGALPGHFHSGKRDLEGATAAMLRIMEIEGEPCDRETARAFVEKLSVQRADEIIKGGGKYPIDFNDMWGL